MTQLGTPTFIISIDMEMMWSCIREPQSKWAKHQVNDNTNGRGSVEILLNIFEKYDIPATWAIVGHLFLDSCHRENSIVHKNMPRFEERWYSHDPATDIKRDPLYYGKDIIEKILSNKVGHEIGSHSFSHVPFSDCSREVAEAEIKESIEIAKSNGITLRSFVFPWNKIGHVDVLREYGFAIYRGTNIPGRYAGRSILIRAPMVVINSFVAHPTEPIWENGIWEIPSSMIFGETLIPFTLLFRAKAGIRRAIKHNSVFHIFLHPQDLLKNARLADKLDELLAFVAQKRDRGNLRVVTMGEFASSLNRDNYVGMQR